MILFVGKWLPELLAARDHQTASYEAEEDLAEDDQPDAGYEEGEETPKEQSNFEEAPSHVITKR